MVHLPDITNEITTRNSYSSYYKNYEGLAVAESEASYGTFSNAVIYNNYSDFITKVVHYIKFI